VNPRQRLTRTAPVFVLLALLAGCAPAVPTPTHTAARATPSPSPSTASAPGSRVPLGCSGLLDASSWQALAGTGAKVDLDENTAPANLASTAQAQYGALTCDWDGTTTASASNPGSELTVVVAPDAKTGFDSRFAAIMADQTQTTHPAAIQNIAGTQSGYWCGTDLDALGADADLPICDAEMLVSNYWVSVQVGTVTGFTRPQLTAGLTAALIELAAKLKAAGPPPAQWTAPATPPGFCTSGASTATVRAIIGDPTLASDPPLAPTLYAQTIGLVGRDVSCAWTSAQSGAVSIELLAGGSWVFPGFTPKAPSDSVIQGPYAATAIPGASSALLACTDDSCEAYLAIGTTAADIYTPGGPAASKTWLAALVKAIAAS